MNRSLSLKIRESQIIYKGQPSRHSVDNSTINLDLRGLNNITPIVNKSLYTKSKKFESPQYSPTTSQILSTLNKEGPFKIDKIWIRKIFEAEYNRDKRD